MNENRIEIEGKNRISSIGATLSRTTMRINGKSPARTVPHYSTVYFPFIVSIVHMRAHVSITLPPLPFFASSFVDCRFLIDFIFRVGIIIFIFCEWLVMPLRNRNFYAKSTQKEYLRKPIFNIRNLYAPFSVWQKSNDTAFCACSLHHGVTVCINTFVTYLQCIYINDEHGFIAHTQNIYVRLCSPLISV